MQAQEKLLVNNFLSPLWIVVYKLDSNLSFAMKKKIVILGSTGNLGQQVLEVLHKHLDAFEIIALSGCKNEKLLLEQAKKFKIKTFVATSSPRVLSEMAKMPEADIVVNTLSGVVGVGPTKVALKANKTVLLANKEALVIAGDEIMNIPNAKKNIIPLDSEHYAIYEILKTHPGAKIDYVILPCSGGPFIGKTPKELKGMTAAEALKHPRWNMGAKITIESATLLNKGMEVIEAHHLFGLPLNKIIVKIHPEAKIKGAVKFKDGKLLAYVSEKADMREIIKSALQKALLQADTSSKNKTVFLTTLSTKVIPGDEGAVLSLPDPDHKTFPGIKIVTQAFRNSQKLPPKLRQKYLKDFLKKEEVFIDKFLRGKIFFSELFQLARFDS